MTTREIIKALESAGFKLLRNGARHLLYAKGNVVVPVCPGRSCSNPRAAVSLRAAIRRAERGVAVGPGRYI